jgi:two-component system, chemotaxis family, chemotaxis protein CheY
MDKSILDYRSVKMAKILIADDSATMRKTLNTILTEYGFTVITEASNGYEACIAFDKHLPDLLTLDINMPFIDGIEALRAIMSKHPYAKIIMISSESCSSLISHALNMGAMDYVIKPFNIQSLVNTINKALQSNASISDHSLKGIYSKINAL